MGSELIKVLTYNINQITEKTIELKIKLFLYPGTEIHCRAVENTSSKKIKKKKRQNF